MSSRVRLPEDEGPATRLVWQQIIAIVRQLEAEGVLSLQGAVGEQYVV